jgi:hypothetical protein
MAEGRWYKLVAYSWEESRPPEVLFHGLPCVSLCTQTQACMSVLVCVCVCVYSVFHVTATCLSEQGLDLIITIWISKHALWCAKQWTSINVWWRKFKKKKTFPFRALFIKSAKSLGTKFLIFHSNLPSQHIKSYQNETREIKEMQMNIMSPPCFYCA